LRRGKPKAEKDLRDGTYSNKADADNAIHAKIDELKGKLQAACLDLHSKEGLIEVTFIKGRLPPPRSRPLSSKLRSDWP
jgi:hypothetical protein